MIKLVAFDWNGTLFADTNTVVKADNTFLGQLGLKTLTVQKYRQTFHVPIIEYYANLGLSRNLFKKYSAKIDYLFQKAYEPMADKCRTRAGAKQLLAWLKNNQVESTIYSNHTIPNIERQLKRLKIDTQISKILARSLGDLSHYKNRIKEQKLVHYIKSQKFKPREVVSIGDTEEEIEIGKKYGYHTVAITGGYNTTARLKKHHPDFLIHNMKELIGIIKKLNK